MNRMMSIAGITPHTANVHSGDAELARITGACAPTGIPVTIPDPVVERPRYSGSTGSAGSGRTRRNRPAHHTRSTPASQGSRAQQPRRARAAA